MGINEQKYEPKRPQFSNSEITWVLKKEGFRQSDFYAFYTILHNIGTPSSNQNLWGVEESMYHLFSYQNSKMTFFLRPTRDNGERYKQIPNATQNFRSALNAKETNDISEFFY